MTSAMFALIVLHYVATLVVGAWLRARRERRESKLWYEELQARLRRQDEFYAQRRKMEGLE